MFRSGTDEILRPLLLYTKLCWQRNVDVRGRLKVQSVIEEMQTYYKNCKERAKRVQDKRLAKLELPTSGKTK
jgi:hypothetical protein